MRQLAEFSPKIDFSSRGGNFLPPRGYDEFRKKRARPPSPPPYLVRVCVKKGIWYVFLGIWYVFFLVRFCVLERSVALSGATERLRMVQPLSAYLSQLPWTPET